MKIYNIGIIGAGMSARNHLENSGRTGRTRISWIAAVRAGKHVLLEKPIAMNMQEVNDPAAVPCSTGGCTLSPFTWGSSGTFIISTAWIT